MNNAGYGDHDHSVATTPDDLAQRMFTVNVFAPLALTREALPHIRKAKGNIVYITSVAGKLNVMLGFLQQYANSICLNCSPSPGSKCRSLLRHQVSLEKPGQDCRPGRGSQRRQGQHHQPRTHSLRDDRALSGRENVSITMTHEINMYYQSNFVAWQG